MTLLEALEKANYLIDKEYGIEFKRGPDEEVIYTCYRQSYVKKGMGYDDYVFFRHGSEIARIPCSALVYPWWGVPE